MNATDPANPGPLNGFADEVARRVTGGNTVPLIVFGPKWAQESEGAEPPPDDLSKPVWAREEGWMEKDDAPIREDGSGPIAMYAPDDMDELDTGE